MKTKIILLVAALTITARAGVAQEYAVRFAESEIARFPEAWQLDHGSRLYFGYSQGVGCSAMLRVWEATGNRKFYDYVEKWTESLVDDQGNIHLYRPEDYNLDFINSGKVLFDVYKQTGKPKYKAALDLLVKQLQRHPRTSEGGFWHKLIYQHQMWLDGLYMASPFLARYGAEFDKPALLNDAVQQFMICARHTYDQRTGLYYHAWDESRFQRWADKMTGKSPNFWGRSIGWWFMALVDVLDYVPEDHPYRPELIRIVRGLTEAAPNFQDEDGLWWQIIDQPGREGNYQEASVSSMFMYAIAKAVNRKYVDEKYRAVAEKAFAGITRRLIRVEADGRLSLTRCCAVSGLGGSPYRDGSFDYYVNERIRDNDAKATGPFIMGCLELKK
ncbi:MAG: glycoside hydrolase family 88 protein [Odoribacteraceae bacterium]|jgi:unsaturated rhamnogalacturonyl hydrolase|nr:glycoside hydrolase family 88 protein [Odoribacteraceae bacterium]